MRASFKNPRAAQERLLQDIIRTNKDTVYGRQFKLGDIKFLEDFSKKHPIADYSRYEQFVARVAKGQKNVMTTKRVTRLTTTSGTTGKSKLIPQEEYDVDQMLIVLEALQHELFPNVQPMQEMWKIHCNPTVASSEGGIPMAAATSLNPSMVKNMVMYTPPAAGKVLSTLHEAFYVDLLFALRDKELSSSLVSFTSTLKEIIRFLDVHWRDLVEDLSSGSLNRELELDPDTRASLLKALGSGDTQRAIEVQNECEKGLDGIMKRLWPNMEFVSTIDLPGLRHSLKKSIAKGVEIYCSMYACSEGCPVGINFRPFDEGAPEFTLNPLRLIFEFIKVDDMEEPDPPTYFIDEVEVGQRYELLLSQIHGIYRFRFGDVIEVSGFHDNCPKVKVLYRKASLLSIFGEKVDQLVVTEAVDRSLIPWAGQITLLHFCVAESPILEESRSSHYIIFLELKSENANTLPDDLTNEILSQDIHKGICHLHAVYQDCCDSGELAPAKVHITKPGAFVQLRDYILRNTGAARAQFKMPKKLRRADFVEVMLQNSMK